MIGLRNEIYNRELNWTEQFAAALHVFAANFRSILKVLLVIFLPIALVEYVLLQRMEAVSAVINGLDAATVDPGYMAGMFSHMLMQELLLGAVAVFLQPVGVIAIGKIAKQYLDGEKIEAMKAISEALTHMPAIIITGILYGVLVMLGSFVIVPGIYFGIAWGFYYFCIGFEGKKGWEALRSSKALVQGKWWKTFGYMLLLSCVSILWNSVFELLCSFFGNNVVSGIAYHILSYISVGFVAVGEALLYLNRRAVAEGACVFDRGFVQEQREDAPAEPVEGTVEGAPTEGSVEKREEKEEENKHE